MARPNQNLFNDMDLKLEGSLVKIINSAKEKPGPGTKDIIDRALDELSNLYRLIKERAGK